MKTGRIPEPTCTLVSVHSGRNPPARTNVLHLEKPMERALLAMLTKTVREIERQKPGTIELLRNALDVLEAERDARRKADVDRSPVT
jgi:hypothetical protein